MKKSIVAAVAALWIGGACGAQQFGIEVYPGAKPAPDVAKMLKDSMQVEASTYTTSDPVEKVTAFYGKQAGLKPYPGADKESAVFMAKGIMVTIQNPWMDMQTGKLVPSTLVTIAKQ